jgi:hypothetical protein
MLVQTKMFSQTVVFNEVAQLIAGGDIIDVRCRESITSYICNTINTNWSKYANSNRHGFVFK